MRAVRTKVLSKGRTMVAPSCWGLVDCAFLAVTRARAPFLRETWCLPADLCLPPRWTPAARIFREGQVCRLWARVNLVLILSCHFHLFVTLSESLAQLNIGFRREVPFQRIQNRPVLRGEDLFWYVTFLKRTITHAPTSWCVCVCVTAT